MSVSNPLPSAEDLTTFARIAAFISDEKRRMAALDDTQKAIAAYNDAIAANAAKIEAAQVELEKLERVRQAADAHAADLAAREAKLAEGQRVLAEATAALNEENALNVKDLKIDGRDVMEALALPPGPKIGKVLDALLEKVLDDPSLNTRETLLKLVGEIPHPPSQ